MHAAKEKIVLQVFVQAMNVQEKSLCICSLQYIFSYHCMWRPSSIYSAHSSCPEYFRSYCSIVTLPIFQWRWYTVVCGLYHNYQRVTGFQASATKWMRTELFWAITQRVVVIS